jgi:hypothetical protein
MCHGSGTFAYLRALWASGRVCLPSPAAVLRASGASWCIVARHVASCASTCRSSSAAVCDVNGTAALCRPAIASAISRRRCSAERRAARMGCKSAPAAIAAVRCPYSASALRRSSSSRARSSANPSAAPRYVSTVSSIARWTTCGLSTNRSISPSTASSA